ncbi:TPA: helix-turn-helix domain-containing protein [Streptococcus pneumoniae]|jgi:transcriptional regulator
MNRLKELRKRDKITQVAFAKDNGIPLRTLQSWENGESQIKPEKAQQLADIFGVSVGYLLGHEENTSEQLNNLITDLEEKLTQYREQYDVMKEILSERLQYLDQVLHEDEIHRGKAITTLHTIKALVDSSEEMFELILSIKENHFKSEKLRLIIETINQTNELIEKNKNNESPQKLDSSDKQ